jgi:hypothetical protein
MDQADALQLACCAFRNLRQKENLSRGLERRQSLVLKRSKFNLAKGGIHFPVTSPLRRRCCSRLWVFSAPGYARLNKRAPHRGVSSEFRWQYLNRFSSPLDLTLSFEPQWLHIDNTSGQNLQSYVLPVRLLADMALIPEKTFVAFNLSYAPTFARIGGTWQQQNPVEIALAATTAIPGNAFLGVETRQSTLNQHGFFSGRALFVGPSLFVRLSNAIIVKVTWEAQIPAETAGHDDLVNFERNEIRAQFAWDF